MGLESDIGPCHVGDALEGCVGVCPWMGGCMSVWMCVGVWHTYGAAVPAVHFVLCQ